MLLNNTLKDLYYLILDEAFGKQGTSECAKA